MTCPRCRIALVSGIAIESTVTPGSPDLGGDVMTFSVGGPGVVVPCLKCPGCGFSRIEPSAGPDDSDRRATKRADGNDDAVLGAVQDAHGRQIGAKRLTNG